MSFKRHTYIDRQIEQEHTYKKKIQKIAQKNKKKLQIN